MISSDLITSKIQGFLGFFILAGSPAHLFGFPQDLPPQQLGKQFQGLQGEKIRKIRWSLAATFDSLGKIDHDLTVLPNPGIMVNKGNHPKMALLLRLVKYFNLPRIIVGMIGDMEVSSKWGYPKNAGWFMLDLGVPPF